MLNNTCSVPLTFIFGIGFYAVFSDSLSISMESMLRGSLLQALALLLSPARAGYAECPAVVPGMINVHWVAHTHNVRLDNLTPFSNPVLCTGCGLAEDC